MLTSMERLHNLENLRDYVNKILCQHDQLELDAFRMTEIIHTNGLSESARERPPRIQEGGRRFRPLLSEPRVCHILV